MTGEIKFFKKEDKMPTHDIIDNQNEKLADHINAILKSSERCKFAVGYFFLSGFTAVQEIP